MPDPLFDVVRSSSPMTTCVAKRLRGFFDLCKIWFLGSLAA